MPRTIDLKNEKITIEDFLKGNVALDDLIIYQNETTPKKALVFLAKQCRTWGVTKEQVKSILIYFKNETQKLYQAKRLNDNDLTFLAFDNYDIAKILLEEKLISPNIIANENILQYDHFLNDCIGLPLIHRFNSNKLLRELIKFGADINLPSQNPGTIEFTNEKGQKCIWHTNRSGESEVGLTLYEVAVKNKQKGLIKALLQILPQDKLEVLNQGKLKELLAEKDYKKQYKILVESAREGNVLVLDELINHVEKYKDALLFDGTKKINKDILHYSLEFGQKEYVQKLIDLAIFPKDNEHCYTTFALEKKQSEVALMAFNEGYYHQENLINSMNSWSTDNSKAYAYIGNVFNDSGIKIALTTLFNRGIHSFLESSFSNYISDTTLLIDEKPYIFDIGDVKMYNDNNLALHETIKKPKNNNNPYYEQHITITQDKIKFVFKLLKCMFENNMDTAQYHFNEFMDSISQAPEKQMMTYLKIGITIIPEKEREIIDQIKNDTIRANFEKKLFENSIIIEEDEIYVPKKKFKI